MAKKLPPETKISTTNEEQILVRNKDLVHELIGKVSFTEMFFLHLMQRMPSEGELAVFDSVLVTLMEHGLTPSAIATRLTIMSAPESVQGAISAGLQGIGSGLVGTMEGMAKNLQDIMEADESIEAICLQIATSYKKSKQAIPGFGHPFHKPDDPRTPRLFEIALNVGVKGQYIEIVTQLSKAVDEVYGKHLTINATGAIAVVLTEIGVPWDVMRGIAVVTRSAGLLGHIREEREHPIAPFIYSHIEKTVPYTGERKLDEK